MPLRVLIPEIDASQVITGRFDKDDLEATADKVFKGAGIGSSCTEADSGGLTEGEKALLYGL